MGVILFRVIAGIVASAVTVLATTSARAQSMHVVGQLPADCRALLPPSVRGTFQSWQVFVSLEHCDRIKRIKRISDTLPPNQRPQFFEAIVPASRLPAEFRVDVPVLRVVFPDRTFFDTDQSALRPEAIQIARLIAENLRKEPPDVSLFVAGHADSRGDRAYNEVLSIDRANTIAEEIFRSGVNFSSIWRIGFGEDMPLVAGETSDAWDRNRRIEFLFAAKKEATSVWLSDNQLDGLCQGRNRSQVEKCKATLQLKDDYRVVEVVTAKPRRANVKGVGSALTVSTEPGTRVKVRPAGPVEKSVAPRAARMISINPRARSSKSIDLNL